MSASVRGKTRSAVGCRPTTTRALRFALMALSALALAGCGGKPYYYHYKIVVHVRDHGELKSATGVAGVREMVASRGGLMESRVCGEAVGMPLRNGRYIFVLLNGLPREPGHYAWRDTPTAVLLSRLGFPVQFGGPGEDSSGVLRLMHTTEAITITGDELPEFMTFGNLNDPKTAQRVEPEDLKTTLGDDVVLEKVTLQATEDDITVGKIRSVLPWLNGANNYIDASFGGDAVRFYHTQQFENCSGRED